MRRVTRHPGPRTRRFAPLAALACLLPVTVGSVELSLGVYQRPEGAIAVHLDGESVDPYFAGKALLTALDLHVDARPAARAWIDWLLPYQRTDGGFDRLCRRQGQYQSCASADSDDATAAVWIELLVRCAPRRDLPPRWKASLERADRLLAAIRDPDGGLHRISASLPVSLLMDNVEVYSAFQAVRAYHARRGEAREARRWARRAQGLGRDILRTFWDPRSGFRPSTQERTEHGFYPDQVAQLFPLLARLRPARTVEAIRYGDWMARNRDAWRAGGATDYPWGLVAVAAERMHDRASVECWRVWAAPLRHGPHWNVLEEAIYASFAARSPMPPRCDR